MLFLLLLLLSITAKRMKRRTANQTGKRNNREKKEILAKQPTQYIKKRKHMAIFKSKTIKNNKTILKKSYKIANTQMTFRHFSQV